MIKGNTHVYTETNRKLIIKGSEGKYRARATINLRKYGSRDGWGVTSIEVEGKKYVGYGFVRKGEIKLRSRDEVECLMGVLRKALDKLDSEDVAD